MIFLHRKSNFSNTVVFALLIVLLPRGSNAQWSDTVQLPLIMPTSYSVYLSETGNDSGPGDSLLPVATFSTALNRIDSLSSGQNGDVYAEVVIYPGTYRFALLQRVNQFQIGPKKLHVSVRGIGNVILDGTGLSLTGGEGMVRLMGNHIYVKNIHILYSPSDGIRFGFDYMGTVINPHDILIENVEVSQTAGHGILCGIGPLNTANPLAITPFAERFLVKNCYVHHTVNFNQPQPQWGSAIKLHNVRHGTVTGCLVHDNAGEGIDIDFGEYIAISGNTLFDNYANIYVDKGEYIAIRNNFIYTTHRRKVGILLGIEPFSSLMTNHYVRHVFIANNIILNTPMAISIWQGSYSGLQNGYFSDIQILHNTLIGKSSSTGGLIGFSYVTSLGQPAPNVFFSNLVIKNNILSGHPDSIQNNNLIDAPLNPQPALTTEYNLWNILPASGFDSTNSVNSLLPSFADPLKIESLVPHADSNTAFVFAVPRVDFVDDDFNHTARFPAYTNAGALELDTTTSSLSTVTLNDRNVHYALQAFPNPFTDYTTIPLSDLPTQEVQVQLYDINGRNMAISLQRQQHAVVMHRGNLQRGMYIYCITTPKTISCKKLIVQ
ncbi:MAG: hypothetical protein KatS3mg031_1391 [Chitinophagales bacterium]|nr:MAG: hypothetical protein KatS3mg031_1391 [Chitinophagales bacterium]